LQGMADGLRRDAVGGTDNDGIFVLYGFHYIPL
jgi:hypothetical protein